MFKCIECGTEFDIKPEYCDCGNNIFEEIKTARVSQRLEETVNKKEQKDIKSNSIPTIKVQNPTPKQEKPSDYDRLKRNFDPISLGIFLFCIVLSLIIVLFVGNPKETTPQNNKNQEVKTEQKQNIPSINSFWNNSTDGVVSDNIVNEPQPTNPQATETTAQTQPNLQQPQIIYIHESAPSPWPQNTSTQQNSSKTQTAAATSKPQSVSKQPQTSTVKNTTPSATSKATTQNTNNLPKVSTPAQNQNKPTATSPFSSLTSRIQNNINFNNNSTNATNPAQTNAQQKTITSSAANIQKTSSSTTYMTTNSVKSTQQESKTTVSAPQPSTVSQTNSAAAKQELANYKISLRNTIGRKIDFTKVVGDGDCTITFKLDSYGKLTNRTFSKQSSNITLNDAVYAAMMSTPSFNAPPAAYNNETLKLTVKFYNGNFEISLN